MFCHYFYHVYVGFDIGLHVLHSSSPEAEIPVSFNFFICLEKGMAELPPIGFATDANCKQCAFIEAGHRNDDEMIGRQAQYVVFKP